MRLLKTILFLVVLIAARTCSAAGDENPPKSTSINSIGMQFIRIPAGEFVMGNHEPDEQLLGAFAQYEPRRIGELSDERPLHKVRVKEFGLGMHEVTTGQFKKFVDDARYQTDAERTGGGWGYHPKSGEFVGRKPEYSWRNPGFVQGDDHPVVNVSWNDAKAFCEWLSGKDSSAHRLPTEAEWEYACRAGTTTRYHFGDNPEQSVMAANIYDASSAIPFPTWKQFALLANDQFPFTAPVGSFRANSFGLFDMHGNVWEWCADKYADDYYSKSPVDDPQGPTEGHLRVRRGGAWHSWALYTRSTFRNWNTPQTRYLNLGFRVARE